MKKFLTVLLAALVALSAFAFTSCGDKKSENVLRVGMECGYQPYNWTQLSSDEGAVAIDGRKGQYANGYDVQIARKIADSLGKTLEIHALDWESLIPGVQSGTLDLIIAGMSPTDERKEKVDFSVPYYESNLVIVVRKDGKYADATSINDFSGAKIVAQSGTFHDEVVDQIPDVLHQSPLKDFPTMVTALKANTIDGYIAEEPGATADCGTNNDLKYIPLKNNTEGGFTVEDLSNVTLAVGVKKGSDLLARVNAALNEIGEEERFSLMSNAVELAKTYAVEITEDDSFFASVAKVWNAYYVQLFTGVGYTLLISLASTLIGLLIGILVGIIKTIPSSRKKWLLVIQKIVNFLLSCYIEVFRSTPMMVQAMVIYWGYAFLSGGVTLPLLPSAIFIVSINTGAYISEIVRGGIISVDKGQYEGAQSIGMNHFQIMVKVVMPQVLRNILPAVSNEFVINIKDTSVLNVIGVAELFYQATIASKATFAIFETYAIVSVMYFVMTFTITRLLRFVEKMLDGKKNYVICGSQSDSASMIKVSEEGTPND